MADLFQKIEDKRSDYNVDIYVTFLEIYNEEIRDLLAEPGTATPRGGLQIREDKTVKVVGLVELHPTSADQIKEIVLLGNTRRTQSPTHANETSSRSHAVLQVHVTQSPRTASTTEQRCMATLSIIDLAGSERAAATTNMGQRMVEGANINKSLLALGNCINALCESGGATRHVPYRNSKLTRLLKFSLGGNCKTVMIVCIAPASNHFDDTHNTLLYADRASKIKTKVVTRNVVNVDRHVGQYVEAINRLNLEVAELKNRLAGKINNEAEIARRKREQGKAEVERAKDDVLRKFEQARQSIVAGAACDGKLHVAHAKLQAFRSRITQITEHAASSASSPDVTAELKILQSLASQEESILSPGSTIQTQLLRLGNADSMFDAMLRAVTERRSDKLDDSLFENIKLYAQVKKAQMEKEKMDTQCETLKETIAFQSNLLANLIGIITRCTVMLEDGSKVLEDTSRDNGPSLDIVKEVSMSLGRLAKSNSETFNLLVGQVIEGTEAAGSLKSFNHHISFASSFPGNSQAHQTKVRPSRRISSLGTTITSPGRRSLRSPRKSLRSSVQTGGHGRRVVSERATEKKKAVQWKDEAGKGDLDDGGLLPVESDIRASSPRLSESEWEDEKTDDSFSYSFTSASSSANTALSIGPRRPRASRLDPSFLKSRAPSSLCSLAEDDETRANETMRKSSPLADRMNQLPTPPDSGAVLHIPKGRERDGSPTRRVPSVLKVPGTASKHGRRRSNIGPLRSEKTRRRSSQLPIPAISITEGENIMVKPSARRVPLIQTPLKRPKRTSLLNGRVSTSLRSSLLRSSPINPLSDINGSGDMSFRGQKPSWR